MRRLLALLLVLASFLPTTACTYAATPADTVYVDPAAGVTPLVALIASARHSIDGETYLLSSKPVLSALEDAAARGVVVHVALEQHPDGGGSLPKTAYAALAAHKVQVRWTSPTFRFTHAKYLVADDTTAWIGTMNWTTSAFTGNREFGIKDTDPAVVSESEAVFAADWAHTPFTGNAGALVLSPVNSRTDIDALITSAKHSLDVYAEEVNDSQQEQLLIAAVKRGVKVRLVCTGDGDIKALQAGGVQVVVKKTPYIHAKAFIVDGAEVFLGSENISTTSLDKNREMGLILHDSAAITAVETVFAQDVGGAAVPVTGSSGGSGTAQPTAIPTILVGGIIVIGRLSVRVTVSPSTLHKGTTTTISAVTIPGASCTVRVVYPSGTVSASASIKTTQTAGSNGMVSWDWKPSSTKAGTGSVTVTCSAGGKTATGTAAFTLT